MIYTDATGAIVDKDTRDATRQYVGKNHAHAIMETEGGAADKGASTALRRRLDRTRNRRQFGRLGGGGRGANHRRSQHGAHYCPPSR